MQVENLSTCSKKYSIIYADPPWSYKRKGGPKHIGTAHQTYKSTMIDEDIYALPVKDICTKNAILFLWVTFPKLPIGLTTIQKWGFEYKTCGFSWIKVNKKKWTLFWGTGHYTRANAEICLIGVKGKPKIKRHDIHSVVIAPNVKHSRKPTIVRDRIVKLCGDLPRIELFATQQIPKWDCFGNEIENDTRTS
ncbi:MAG: MT-A70 family methyltransferase [Methanogenium sp.]|jgi:N6-adenosine-specific RNA methylase IME4